MARIRPSQALGLSEHVIGVRHRLGALQEPRFRLLWTAQSLSSIGDTMVPVAVAFAALALGGSATSVGLVLAAGLVPRAALLLVGGVWADRLPRQRVMLASDLVRGVSQSVGALLLLTGSAHIWHLGVIAAVHGGAAAFFVPASTGLVPETVTAARLQQANALVSLSRNALGIVGPAIAGLVVAGYGPGWVYAVDAASFAASAWFLVRLPVEGDGRQRESFLAELVSGWRELTARTWIWASVLYFSISNLALACFFVLGPVISARELDGARDWGLILTGGGVGSVIGGLLALRLRPQRPLATGYVLVSVGVVPLLLLMRPFPALVVGAASLLSFAVFDFSATLWTTTLQEQVPRDAISRVSAYDWLGSLVFLPVGLALTGPLAGWIGTDTTLLLAAGLLLVCNLAILSVPGVRAVRRHDSGTPVKLVPDAHPT